MTTPANLIDGRWEPIPGQSLVSRNPADPSRTVYSCSPRLADVAAAVAAARAARGPWGRLGIDRRASVLRVFADLAKARAGELAELLCDEVGKVLWDARAEAGLLASKVDITLDPAREGGLHRVSGFDLTLSPTRVGRCSFRPHGVMAVIGPFNFPAHLPNGHIIPALLAGNTVVFKPSDKAPAVGQWLAGLYDQALRTSLGDAYIPGVVNLVQGGGDVASALSGHPGLDAVAFTGSWAVGRRILEANLDRPARVVALEMGGSNPAIVMPDADLRAAAIELVRCAFITSGQRCTCTRRAIIHRDVADRLIPALTAAARSLAVGHPRRAGSGATAPAPVFMGPVVSEAARRSVLDFQAWATAPGRGGRALLPATSLDRDPLGPPAGAAGWFVTPGLLSVPRFTDLDQSDPAADAGCDTEVFGPLLRISTAGSLDDALEQANATRYGLAASIFTADAAAQDRFLSECRAGCLNVNTGTAGASSKLPFGGLGLSGNHRPAGSFALDYCAYPVASMVEQSAASGASVPEGMRFDDAWLG